MVLRLSLSPTRRYIHSGRCRLSIFDLTTFAQVPTEPPGAVVEAVEDGDKRILELLKQVGTVLKGVTSVTI